MEKGSIKTTLAVVVVLSIKTFDELYKERYLDVIHNRDLLYSSGFTGYCLCGRLTRWVSVLYDQYVCSEGCIKILDRSGHFDFLETDKE